MRRTAVLARTLLALSATSVLGAQQWNGARALDLVRTATERRTAQLADSGLVDYRATAHGYLTFLAQLGEGFREPPRVVKADELALEVYWRTPNLSKQRIIGRRDTTLLPTDIQYHRDHLGIVQNNFPAIIRLGDGDEVRDVPHPLSPAGMPEYDFALADSLRITMPGRVISVYEVRVRPKDDRQPRVLGALYLDRDNGQVVRMALSFTRAAFLDRQLEDLFVVLENGLVGTRFWLPRRQEIEIRRTATWLDYPIRGIIRGRWEIANYEINQNLPQSLFAGQEIVQAPQRIVDAYAWESERILDSLPPDIRAVTAEEIRRVQAEARELVRSDALRRARGTALAARGLSDFARFNRVEGLSLGAGATGRLGAGLTATARGRYGLQDNAAKGSLELRWERASGLAFRLRASDDFRDVGIVAERSGLVNSIAAQELGSDFTNPFGVRRVGGGMSLALGATRWSFDVDVEEHQPLVVHAAPASGTFRATIPAAPGSGWRTTLRFDQPTRLMPFGFEGQATAEAALWELRGSDQSVCEIGQPLCRNSSGARLAGVIEMRRPVGEISIAARTVGGIARASSWSFPVQELVFLGGPVSLPGYDYHSLAGQGGIAQHVELHLPVPFPSINLGRFGESGRRAMLVPHAAIARLDVLESSTSLLSSSPLVPSDPLRARESGWYPSVGMGLMIGFDLLHFDVSRGTRDGRWQFSVDVSRLFWPVL